MYRTRKRARDEGVTSSVQQSRAESSHVRDDGVASPLRKSRAESSRVRDNVVVASSLQQSRAESSRVRDDGVASPIRKFRAESSTVRDDVAASSIRKFRADSSTVRDDVGASSIRKSRGETSRGPQLARSSVRDDNEDFYPRQDIRGKALDDKVSAILESIKTLPEGEASQRNAYDKMPARSSDVGGIFWKDKSDLEAFRARADGSHTSRHQEVDGDLNGSEALNNRLARLEQLLMSSQTAPLMRQQEDHRSDSLVRLLDLYSDARNVKLGQGNVEQIHRSANISRLLEEAESQFQPRYPPRSHINLETEMYAPRRDSYPTDNSRDVFTRGNLEQIRRRLLEEAESQVRPRYPPQSHRNLEMETIVPTRSSFPTDNSREMFTRGNVTVSSQHANRGIHGRTDSQVQSRLQAPSHSGLGPQISSRPPNALVDALDGLLSGNFTGNSRHRNTYEDAGHEDSRFQTSHRAESPGNLEEQISSPAQSPLAVEDSPEELITGNTGRKGKRAEIHKVQTWIESQVQSTNRSQFNGTSDSQMSSFQPNSLPAEDFLGEGVTGNIRRNKHTKIHKAQKKKDSQLQGRSRARAHEDSEPRLSAAPLNFSPMEDSGEMLRTEGKRIKSRNLESPPGFECETNFQVQTFDPVQSDGNSDSNASLPAQSPKTREESPEVLVTGVVMENTQHGKIRKAKCQPLSQVQDTIPLNSLPVVDSHEVRKKGKRGRGCTRLDEVWNMPEGERIVCEFSEQGQPIKAEGRLLTRFIGTVVRKPDLAPLDVKDWHRMPRQNKEQMWKIVESKFLIPAERREEIKAWGITDLGDKWRQYKCVLRGKYFDESKPLSELVKLRPPSVDKDQWVGLLNLWNSPKWKRISEVNKKNREHHKINHTSGTLSYAMVEAEMKEKTGIAPTTAQVFARTHRHKDGTDVNEETAKAIEEFERFGTRVAEADEAGSTWEGDAVRLGGKRSRLFSCNNRRRSKYLHTIRVSREEYRSNLQHQKAMKDQLRAQDDRLKGLENKMSALLSTLQENLSQHDLVNILKKATQAEAPSDSGGSNPEYQAM